MPQYNYVKMLLEHDDINLKLQFMRFLNNNINMIFY